MRRIESRIDTGSATYAENRAAYEAMVATLRERQQVAIDGGHGRERSIERHLSRGKVLYELQPKTVYEWVTNWWPFLIGDWFWALFVAHREVVEVERNERHKIEPADPKAETRSSCG